jgi:hypothetical protein
MWGMFSKCFSYHYLAVPLFVMLCSFTFLPKERRTPRVLICKPDLSDLTHTGGRKIGPLILLVMPGVIEPDARWSVVLDAFDSLGAP